MTHLTEGCEECERERQEQLTPKPSWPVRGLIILGFLIFGYAVIITVKLVSRWIG